MGKSLGRLFVLCVFSLAGCCILAYKFPVVTTWNYPIGGYPIYAMTVMFFALLLLAYRLTAK